MARRNNRFLKYVLKNRGLPNQNRRRVGQSLILLSVFIFFVFLINFAIIIGTDSKFGVDLSEGAKRVHQTTITEAAKRGTIYDRTGREIAVDSTTYTVYTIIDTDYVSAQKEILYVEDSQFDKVADIFNQYLGMEKSYVLEQLQRPNLKQVYFGTLGKNISYSNMTAISEAATAAGVKGIAFTASPGRLYPNGDFASFFVGLAQLNEDKDTGALSLKGQTGIELAMNDILAGQDGKVTYEKDSYGRIVPGTETVETETINGQDVYTTLSAQLQRSLETNMNVFYSEKTKGLYANATLISAKTGEILATTQRPSFNADTKEGLNQEINWQTTLFQGAFEPGSTMKVMTLAAAIDNNTFNPNEYYTNSTYTLADAQINDWTVNAGRDPQTLTFANGFALSSNVGMTMLEQRMGDETWLNYLSKFRFGYPTRMGMYGEDAGIFPSENIVTRAMSSFGQGISVTNVQMLRAFTAIGNNGVMLQPKFISAIYDANTDSARFSQAEVVGNPVSADAANQTLKYMITVGTDPYYATLRLKDTGPVIQVDGYDIAVKSGTAQIGKEDGTGYLDGTNNTINSVVAMIPAEDPEFIMYVTVQQPESWSIAYWQDIFNPVLKEAMLLKDSLNLTTAAPILSGVTAETDYLLPDVIDQSPGDTADELRRHLVQPVILGNGPKITKVSAEVGSNLGANQQLLLLTDNFTEIPDMYGWTKENVDVFSSWTDIEISYRGQGSKVVDQSADVGASLEKTNKLTITLGE